MHYTVKVQLASVIDEFCIGTYINAEEPDVLHVILMTTENSKFPPTVATENLMAWATANLPEIQSAAPENIRWYETKWLWAITKAKKQEISFAEFSECRELEPILPGNPLSWEVPVQPEWLLSAIEQEFLPARSTKLLNILVGLIGNKAQGSYLATKTIWKMHTAMLEQRTGRPPCI